MGDQDLRELERRFRQSGELAHEEAWFQQLVRTGALEQRLEALVERADRHEAEVLASDWIEPQVLHLDGSIAADPAVQVGDAVEAAGYLRPAKLRARTARRPSASSPGGLARHRPAACRSSRERPPKPWPRRSSSCCRPGRCC